MAIILGNYEQSKRIAEMKNNNAYESAMTLFRSLGAELLKFQKDLNDMRDTYHYVKNDDSEFSSTLWNYLCGYTYKDIKNHKDGHYLSQRKVDMCSNFGVRAEHLNNPNVNGYYTITLSPTYGLVLYTHYNGCGFGKDIPFRKAEEYIAELPQLVKNYDKVMEIINGYNKSMEELIKYFPHYRDKFFEVVSKREWDYRV